MTIHEMDTEVSESIKSSQLDVSEFVDLAKQELAFFEMGHHPYKHEDILERWVSEGAWTREDANTVRQEISKGGFSKTLLATQGKYLKQWNALRLQQCQRLLPVYRDLRRKGFTHRDLAG